MAFSQIIIERINALAELDLIGWAYEPIGNSEVKIKCPFPGHADSNPSASLNTDKNVWKCYASGCNGKGSIITLLSLISQVDKKTILLQLSERYDLEVIKTISIERIEEYHQAIWKSGPFLQDLEKRAIGKDLIREARLGYNNGRITIPIFNSSGQVINLRRYLPGAKTNKFTHAKGFKTLAIYQPKQLKYDTLFICGGELKALAIRPLANSINIGAIAITGGEGTWDKEFTKLIVGKTIYIVMDIDGPGKKASNEIASQIKGSVQNVLISLLPLDIEEFPKGDMNDWLFHKKPTSEDLKKLLSDSKPFEFMTEFESLDMGNGEVVLETTLSLATDPKNIGLSVRMSGVISGIDLIPFMLPKDVRVHCPQDQPNCHKCPMRSYTFTEEEGTMVEIPNDSYGVLELFNTPKDKQKKPIQISLGIPDCKPVCFKVVTYYSVYEARLTPHLSLRNIATENYRVQPSLIVTTEDLEMNMPYTLTGRVYPDPKTQQAVLVINKLKPTSDSLNSCLITQDELEALKIFRPKNWDVESIEKQLEKLYSDMERNVTRIYGRRDLHLSIDLAWCSVLYFNFDGRQQNGWLNLLIIGDSAQGKTETSLRLMEHYGLGIKHDCKNASVAGLLGGVEQMGQRRFIMWGIIPSNDRKLVILDELKGASKEVISQLTDMRSSGIAEITKIERRKAHARTRLIMISNSRSSRAISSYNFGVESIRELIGAPEDVRRYDLAIVLSNKDIPPSELNMLLSDRPHVEHIFSNELCKLNILWAWTRKKEQIHFENEAISQCLESAIQLCNMFSEDIPLVDRATIKFKVARLSIALAVRTFSTNEELNVVIVRKCHILYIAKFLISMYARDSFGYDRFTDSIKFQNTVIDKEDVVKKLLEVLYPQALIDHLLNSNEISSVDIGDWCDLDMDGTRSLISYLVRKHALKREGRFYLKTIGFIELLRKLNKEKKTNLVPKVEIEL